MIVNNLVILVDWRMSQRPAEFPLLSGPQADNLLEVQYFAFAHNKFLGELPCRLIHHPQFGDDSAKCFDSMKLVRGCDQWLSPVDLRVLSGFLVLR